MNSLERVGLSGATLPEKKLVHAVNLKLAALGCAPVDSGDEEEFQEVAWTILSHHRAPEAPAGDRLCPVDQRIQNFLDSYYGPGAARLPRKSFVLDRYGLARALSIPQGGADFTSGILNSYKVRQGVLHNPKSDRRTTQGIFHVVEGGLPIPDDKSAVPKEVFVKMFNHAFLAPRDLLRLPYTAGQSKPAEVFVSLLLRPLLCPAIPGFTQEKSIEVRFFAPGSLVSNLDFVESIFGNAGDPFLIENDAGLDVDHWSGHTGCVILAPHLITLTKKEVGLPHYDQATDRQRRDGMCWKNEEEKYNNGGAFKLTCRTEAGVMVTLIADNYFGYCKKEVKTQLSYAANLFGTVEEEHAGGAYVYPSYDLGREFSGHLHVRGLGHSFQHVLSVYRPILELKPEGYAVDVNYPDIFYVPENVHFDLVRQTVTWENEQGWQTIKLLAGKTYVRPSGYKVHLEKVQGSNSWHLVGTIAEPMLCHKPCTVSGGGKSEISKSIRDAILHGAIYVADIQKDFDLVAELVRKDYSGRFASGVKKSDERSILSPSRSLGSVIKLLTPSEREYSREYNAWLGTIPQYIKELVYVVKRFYKPEWGNNWREHFTVDRINGKPGNELKFENRPLVANYLRVGYEADGAWRTFALRSDYYPAAKIQAEDDITAAAVVPARHLKHLHKPHGETSFKFVQNCEYRLFQRPDDAIHRGYDKQTELDFSQPANFFSNYEPLVKKDAEGTLEDAIGFDQFTEPMKQIVRQSATDPGFKYWVSTSNPRLVDGKPSKNPRYLQIRPDLLQPRAKYLAEMAARLHRRLPLDQPVLVPVSAVVPGRRNNPPDPVARIRPLAVYNPVHYMELPELFMEYICSMTGKSPSTTGAGSEGALTKGPFNALPPIYDLNAALVSYILTDHHAFVTAAGYVGPHSRVDHDVSLLIPEVWSRMTQHERLPANLIEEGCLEACEDFEHEGKTVLASRLGYRITEQFVVLYFGRIFAHPDSVFTPEMLRPELQDLGVFVDGMDNIIATQKRVAEHYFNDQSVELACPPLKALLHIMRDGRYDGKTLRDEDIRALFSKDALLASSWYRRRLEAKQHVDTHLWQRHVEYLREVLKTPQDLEPEDKLMIKDRLAGAESHLAAVSNPAHLEHLFGTIGVQDKVR